MTAVTQGKMTEGAVCVLDSWKMAFGAVKNMTQGGGRRRGGRRQVGIKPGGRGRSAARKGKEAGGQKVRRVGGMEGRRAGWLLAIH